MLNSLRFPFLFCCCSELNDQTFQHVIKEKILLPGAKVWQILGLEIFDVEIDPCLFPTCLHNRLGVSSPCFYKKILKFALPASNKLGSRCSDVVPEGFGMLEFWIFRPCCPVFFSHPETSSFCLVPCSMGEQHGGYFHFLLCCPSFAPHRHAEKLFEVKIPVLRSSRSHLESLPSSALGHWDLHSFSWAETLRDDLWALNGT